MADGSISVTWFTITLRTPSPCSLFAETTTSKYDPPFLHTREMSVLTKESRIILAIEAIRTTRKMIIRRDAKTYDVPESSIRLRMKGTTSLAERRNGRHQLTPTEEETLIRYI